MTEMEGRISIIIPSLNEGNYLQDTVFNITSTISSTDYEIIIVNSGGTQTSKIEDLDSVHLFNSAIPLSPAQAKNTGASKSSGEILLFTDAHVFFSYGWEYKILKALRDENVIISPCITLMGDENIIGCGFKWRNLNMELKWLTDLTQEIHEIPFAAGACMAVSKRTFEDLGQFDYDFRSWGMEDAEISLRAWTQGCNVLCDTTNRVSHKFKTNFPYTVSPKDIYYNRIRLCFLHFRSKRLIKYLRHLSRHLFPITEFNNILIKLIGSDVLNKREDLFNKRIYTDDWFFEKFHMKGWSYI